MQIAGEITGVISDKTQPVWTRLHKNIPVQTRGVSRVGVKPYKISEKTKPFCGMFSVKKQFGSAM